MRFLSRRCGVGRGEADLGDDALAGFADPEVDRAARQRAPEELRHRAADHHSTEAGIQRAMYAPHVEGEGRVSARPLRR